MRRKFASQSHGPARVEHPKVGDSALRLIEERKVVTNAVINRNVVSTPMFCWSCRNRHNRRRGFVALQADESFRA
jgi:hypothetical protein